MLPAASSPPISAQPARWFLAALWGILTLNLFLAVARFQVNVLTWDQWDFYDPLFGGGGMWDLFHYQHGPHRQGLAFVLTSWLLDATSWDSRWDGAWIAALISASGLLALRLKWKLTGRLEWRDAWIPLLGLTLGQFENLLVVPNASHSAAPLALTLLLGNLWLHPNVRFRYLAAGIIAVCLTFTGFGLFAGAVALGLLLVAAVRHLFARETRAAVAAGVGFLTALAGWLVFRADYVFTPAVVGFRFPWDPVGDYFRFIALMLLQPTGVEKTASVVHYLFGTFLAVVALAAAAYLVWQWARARRSSPALDVMVLLIGAGVLFVANTAVGRISLGLTGGMCSRYITLMFPLWLAVALAASRCGRKAVASAATLLLWTIALWPYAGMLHRPLRQWPGTLGVTAAQYQDFDFQTTGKAAWVDAYLKGDSVTVAQAIGSFVYPAPETTHLDDKLRFLRERRLSFFSGPAPSAFLPWLLRVRAVWDEKFPALNAPHALARETKLAVVSRHLGSVEIPLNFASPEASATFDLVIQCGPTTQTERVTPPAVLSLPVQGGFNYFTLTVLASDEIRAGPVTLTPSTPTRTAGPSAPPHATISSPPHHDPSVNPSAFALLAAWLLVAAVLAGPALATCAWLQARGISDERVLLIAPLVVVGLLGYFGFFVFYTSALLGKVFALAVAALAWTFVTRQLRRSPPPPWHQAATVPLLLAVGLSLFYLALLYLPALGQPFASQSAYRFTHPLPPDSILPQILGDRLYAGVSLRPFFIDWLSSDRPPLQAGLYLLILPWLKLLNLPDGLGYQCVGTFAQLVWVPAVWLLGRALGQDRTRSALTVLIVGTVGFVLLNSVFVWPKLLAGGFVVFTGLLLLDRSPTASRSTILLAAACAALGWLAHGSAAFSLLALAPFVLLWHRPSWKLIFAGLALGALIAAPWLLYQKFCDPPGDRLLKWHLAGVIALDPRSIWQALHDAYASLSWDTWVANKRFNLVRLFQGTFSDLFDLFTSSARQRRGDEFFYLFRAIGLLNLAWLVWPVVWIVRRCPAGNPRLCWTSVGWTLLTLAGWVMLMFEPNSTTPHQGSYAALLVACTLAVVLLLDLPGWLAGLILGWHAIYFATTWLPYYGTAPINRGMFLVFPIALAVLARAFWESLKPPRPPGPIPCAGWLRTFSRHNRWPVWQESLRRPVVALIRWLRPPMPRRRFVVLLIGTLLALLVARRPDAFFNPQFWAEDAVLFHTQAEELGWRSLIHPAMGYHHAIPRTVALFACNFVDAALQPAVFNYAAIAVLLLIAGSLASRRWTGPPALAFALVMVLVPQAAEVLCNLTNLQWVTGLFIVITAVMAPPPTLLGKVAESCALAVVGLTGPFAVALLPLHIFRWFRFGRSVLPSALTLALAVTIQAITLWSLRGSAMADTDANHTNWWQIIGQRLFAQTLLPSELWPATDTAYILIGVAGVLFAAVAACYPGPQRSLRVTLFTAALLLQLAIIFRMNPFRDTLNGLGNGGRYFYDARVLLAWLFIVVATIRLPRALRIGAAAWLAGWGLMALANFRIPPLPDLHWADYAESVRAGRRADIPVNPVPYIYHYVGRDARQP